MQYSSRSKEIVPLSLCAGPSIIVSRQRDFVTLAENDNK